MIVLSCKFPNEKVAIFFFRYHDKLYISDPDEQIMTEFDISIMFYNMDVLGKCLTLLLYCIFDYVI